MLARAVLPQARPTAADGDLHFDQSLAGFVNGADPGDRPGIVAGGIRAGASGELTMPFILPDALTEDRKRRSMIDCLGVRFALGSDLHMPRSGDISGARE